MAVLDKVRKVSNLNKLDRFTNNLAQADMWFQNVYATMRLIHIPINPGHP